MSYSVAVSGHIPGDEGIAAQAEAELAAALHELLSKPEYGCESAVFYGQHAGQVNLLAQAGDITESELI